MLTQIKKQAFFLLFILCLIPVLINADQAIPTDFNKDYGRFTETAPPVAPVRPVAEFEPASAVLIRYPLGIPISLVVHLANTAQVICIVSSSSVQNTATTAFTNGGVNMANVSFMIAATDSYWTRDYGPWFIFDGNNQYGVVDFQYNRPRPNDNLIPQVFANQNTLNYYGMNLQQTGGNYMTDGINTAAQTTIAYTENSSLTPAQVDAKMLAYMGVSNYEVLADPNNTYIDHIDCWGKFLAPDKVLIRSVPTSHAQYDEIEAMAAYFASLHCAWGYPYRVYRVNTPQNQPYTNSLILNHKVFVPIMNSTYDAAALQVYRDALPGYEVIGIAGGTATWESTDALHCRTHEIPDKNALYIAHTPHWGTVAPTSRMDFYASLIPYSGQAIIPDSTYVCYKINQGAWQRSYLTHITGTDYSTMITDYAPGDTIRYYIHAADQSGHSRNQPLTAEFDPHMFTIPADTEAPVIVHEPLFEIQNEPTLFVVQVTDNLEVGQVLMRYRINHDQTTEVSLNPYPAGGEDAWSFLLMPVFESGDTAFYYQFEASDTANSANTAFYPAAGEWISVPITGVENADDVQSAPELQILSVYPNPFSKSQAESMSIEYRAELNSTLTLKVFNIKGQAVAELNVPRSSSVDDLYRWDATSADGHALPNGIYFLKLHSGSKTLTHRVLVVK